MKNGNEGKKKKERKWEGNGVRVKEEGDRTK
jgi:hypothetical protein